MENKKKPLIFVPSHHDLTDLKAIQTKGVNFTPEMLKWPISYTSLFDIGINPEKKEKIMSAPTTAIYRNAFEAFMNIGPFNMVMSIEVDPEKKKLRIPKRVWGKVFEDGISEITFSHYSDNDAPFSTLIQWRELREKPKGGHSLSVYGWKNFIFQSLTEKAFSKRAKAKAKRNDADNLDYQAFQIMNSLAEMMKQ
jgi:hypothetical protein